MEKLITSILNSRLKKLSDNNGLIHGVQGGVRKGCSVQDSLFVMYSLISLYLCFAKIYVVPLLTIRKPSTQCGELGFGKQIGVKNGDLQSNFFPCETGARQGKKLYPFLFALYLSDLEEYLSDIYANHLELGIKLYTTYRYVS
jgi:hypothetical protein